MAFCFDEACEYILSMKTTEEVEENGKIYIKEVWKKEPKWIDVEKKDKPKPKNNSSLISEMQNNLKKYK